jgi:hypothetical protein
MLKYCAVLSLCGSLCLAADFVTGQAARLVIGQRTFTAQDPGASQTLVGSVSGLAFAADTLFVVDSNRVGALPLNHRVLIYKNVSTNFPQPTSELPAPVPAPRCQVCGGAADVVLGQPDFIKTDLARSRTGLRLPTAVASDGRFVAVADTQNNRVLIWNNIPDTNGAPADVVLGQADFTSLRPVVVDNKSFRAPQGVWIQDGRLFVADTQNHRVMIWNRIPTGNDTPADVVLGQPNFNVAPEPDLTRAGLNAQNNTLLNPVSVTSDGRRVLVSDLGHHRILIWNSIPTQNQQPADLVLGQKEFTTATPNNTSAVCESTGTDSSNNPTYPFRCAASLSDPRFALSDGTRLFVADGGNDRILVWKVFPTANAQRADVILGQPDEFSNVITSTDDIFNPNLGRSSSDTISSPMSLAWDGVNLYASDPYYRRVLVYTLAEPNIPINGVRNAASREIFAVGSFTFAGTIKENDEITLKIGDKEYKYKIVADDSFANVVNKLVAQINAGDGDPRVLAIGQPLLGVISLTAKTGGKTGNDVTLSSTLSESPSITVTPSGATLSGGQNAATLAPGTIVTILGQNLAEETVAAPEGIREYPRQLGNVEVYFDGLPAPLLMVSPTEIRAQLSWDVNDSNSVSAYVRTRRKDGSVTVTSAVNVPVAPQNPGIFADEGVDPRPGIVMHGSSYATGTVSVDGSAKAGDIATISIEDRNYNYTVVEGDTLATIRDALINLINANPDERVTAFAAGQFTRVRLRAKIPGPEGNGIVFGGKANDGANVIITATNSALCCANVAGARVTEENPALPGETIIVYATGLGLVIPDEAKFSVGTGFVYEGPADNTPNSSVSSLAGGRTANVLFAGLKQGLLGVYEVHLELNSDIATNPNTQLTIAQDIYVSNIIRFAVFNPRATTP